MQKSKKSNMLKQNNWLFNVPNEPDFIPLSCKSLPALIKLMRLSRGWTQKELGELLDVPRQEVQKWEYGHQKPNQKHLRELLKVLKYKTAELVISKFYV